MTIGSGRGSDGGGRERAVSEVTGVVLLFGLVIAGAALVFLTGADAVQQVETESSFESTQDSIEEAKVRIRDVASPAGSGERTLGLPGEAESIAVEEGGTIAFMVNDRSDCTVERDLGTLEYTDEGRQLVYQATAIWRKTDDGQTVMVSSPALNYRTETDDSGVTVRSVTFPLANVNETHSSVDAATKTVARELQNDPQQFREALCLDGPNAVDMVDNVTVRVSNTAYYEAWERYFREEFRAGGSLAANVATHSHNETVIAHDVALGFDDDDGDGYPDPDVPIADYPASETRVDNCPPHHPDAGGDAYNPSQRNGDSDGWGNPCDTTPYGGDPEAPVFEEVNVTTTSVTASGVAVDYEVTVDDDNPDGTARVEGLTVALVDGDSGDDTVYDRDTFDPHAERVSKTGSLSVGSNDGGTYAVVFVANDSAGNRNQTSVPVLPDVDDDGVPDAFDECPTLAADGANGCVSVRTDGDAVVVNQTEATVTEISVEPSVGEVVEDAPTTTRPPLDVTFVLDTTGSMSSNDPSFKRVDATDSFIGFMNASKGDRAAAVVYDTSATTLSVDGTAGLTSDLAGLQSTVDESHPAIDNTGSTSIDAGIQEAASLYGGSSKRVMVLLTDGQDNYGGDPVDAAQAAADKGITIYTVGLGSSVDDGTLQAIADETGGEYLKASDDDDLTDVFDQIANNITDGEEINRVELKQVEGTVSVSGSVSDTQTFGADLNDPTIGVSSVTLSLDNNSRVAVSTDSYDCSDWTAIDQVTHDGTTYNKSVCDGGPTHAFSVGSGDVGYGVYEDGDAVPGVGGGWFRANLADAVTNYDTGLVDTAGTPTFNLSKHQRVFVLYDGQDYTAFLLTAKDDDRSYGASPVVPSVDSGGSPPDPGTVPENRQFLDIDFTGVVVEEE